MKCGLLGRGESPGGAEGDVARVYAHWLIIQIYCFILLDTNYPTGYSSFSTLLIATLTRVGEPEAVKKHLCFLSPIRVSRFPNFRIAIS